MEDILHDAGADIRNLVSVVVISRGRKEGKYRHWT
jgi:hypothetical protein